jgi:hypothetical protein
VFEHQDWTLEDWSRVDLSYETIINRMESDWRAWVWTQPGSALANQHTCWTVNLG